MAVNKDDQTNTQENNQDEYDRVYQPKKDYTNLYDGGSRKKPKCCVACGGPYPLCKDGCSLFDD